MDFKYPPTAVGGIGVELLHLFFKDHYIHRAEIIGRRKEGRQALLAAFNIFTSHLKQKIASYQSPLTLEGGEIVMKPRSKQLVIGAFAAIMLLYGVFATTAEAQGRVIRRQPRVIFVRPYYPFWYRRYDPFWDPFYSTRYRVEDPIAYQREQGYRDGRDEGKKDAKKGRPANPKGHKDYIKSNSLAYREAFVQGYNERFREEMAEIREEMSERQR